MIGPSASGKTSLARSIVGAWPYAAGSVRFDGAELSQFDTDQIGSVIGYLPQRVELFDGTIAENISRFRHDASSEEIITAAERAGVHSLIVELADGYETPVGPQGTLLSAGQRQRIGLARAIYGEPFVIVLDEPNSNLDADGDAALTAAIGTMRRAGSIVIVVAHRPSALAAASHVLTLNEGHPVAFGSRDEVLERVTASAA